MWTKRIKIKMLFKLSNLNSNLALTMSYLNLALNNSALIINSFQALFLLLTLGIVYKNICHELPSLTCA